MALTLEIKVVPSSGKQQCVIDKTGILKCFLKSPPEQGKANEELIKMLSKALKIPQGAIHIIGGATSRKKLISINAALTLPNVLARLGIEQQMSINS